MCDGCGRFKWLFSSYHGTEGIYFVDRHSEIDIKIEHLGSFFFLWVLVVNKIKPIKQVVRQMF